MLPSFFVPLAASYTTDSNLLKLLWNHLKQDYESRGRHYHTLLHLQHMYDQLLPVKAKIEDWDTLLFALLYHDIIYSATAKDNEEKSAAFADRVLNQIIYPPQKIERCKNHILATKSHTLSTDSDTNYFTDADLSILGASWPEYEAYTQAIRKEYSIYPDLLYRPGRRKVLLHFLGMEKIYKTPHFYTLYENTARKNLERELMGLAK